MPALLVAVSAAASAVVLNEVFYDPEGADDGFEFVELAARAGADTSASLQGWILETGNGARPGEWTVTWTGRAGDRLHGGLFLIGEGLLEPAPDAIVDMDLQNGPDACRLRAPGGDVDVLGWGAPLDSRLAEGPAAEDAASGLSLARLPDGVDTDCNSCDWRPSSPSPGDYNAPAIAVVVEDAELPPPDLPPGTEWEFAWSLRNVGRAPWSEDLRLECETHPEETLAVFTPFDGAALPPAGSARVVRRIVPPPGVHLPRSIPPFPTDAPPWRGGGADLAITEVFSRPANDEPEWVELRSLAATSLLLSPFRVADEAGTSASLTGSLTPGAFAVVAQDTIGLRDRWNVSSEVPLVLLSPWPALNHTASAGGVAERVRLLLAGVPLEECSLPGGVEEGRSWERVSVHRPASDPATWSASLDEAGATPGRPNSRDGDRAPSVLPPPGALAAAPRAFAPARDGPALLVLTTRAPAPTCTITLYDSSGIAVRKLDTWRSRDDEHRALWDGRDDGGMLLPLGLYIAQASAPSQPPARATVVLLR